VVREGGGNGPGGGCPWCLPLADRVLLVAVCCRTNLTVRQLVLLLGISSAIVCRVVQRLRPLLALEQAPRPVADVGRLWIVGGTLVPVRDRTVGASPQGTPVLSANVQVVIDADSRLVVASARPALGNKADAHVWRESDLPAAAAGTTVIAGGAYLGTGLIVPHRRRAGLATPAGSGGGQRRAPPGAGPRRAHLRPDEELEDPARLQPEGRRSPPRSPGRRHHAQPRHDTVKQQVRRHSGLPETDLLQHPLGSVAKADLRP
jgi:hypothetical protein